MSAREFAALYERTSIIQTRRRASTKLSLQRLLFKAPDSSIEPPEPMRPLPSWLLAAAPTIFCCHCRARPAGSSWRCTEDSGTSVSAGSVPIGHFLAQRLHSGDGNVYSCATDASWEAF